MAGSQGTLLTHPVTGSQGRLLTHSVAGHDGVYCHYRWLLHKVGYWNTLCGWFTGEVIGHTLWLVHNVDY